MEAPMDDLIIKVKAIAQVPKGDLLRQFVEMLYQRQEQLEEYDDEPLSPQELAAIREAEEAIRRGDKECFTSWEES